MYLPAQFAVDDSTLLVEIMQRHPFATLVGIRDGEPEISHVPLLAKKDRIAGHVARGNPLARLVEAGAPLTAIFHGPHVYISPRFYATTPNVPTWNYVVVHARGPTRIITGDAVMTHIRQMVDTFEGGAWSVDQVAEHAAHIVSGVVAFEITVEKIEGKLKLNQNRKPEDWAAVVAHFENSLDENEREMVALMKKLGR